MKPPFFLPLLLLLFFFAINCAISQDLIHDICMTSEKDDPNIKFNFCTSSLQAAPASHCATLQGLGMITIRLIRYNITDTRCHVKHLLQNKKLDPYVKNCLNDCFELYSDAIPSIKEAMKHYNSQNYLDANIVISSVMDAATTCEDGFSGKEGVVSPLTKRNSYTFQLSAIALSIMNMLQKKAH